MAALLGALGCSAREELIATITREAGTPQKCDPTSAHEAMDMGLDLYFVMDHSWDMTPPEWGQVANALVAMFNSTSPDFAGMGVGFAVYPRQPQSCSDSCPMAPGCSCFARCGCWDARMVDPLTGLCTCFGWQASCNEVDYAPSFETTRATERGKEDPTDFSSRLFETIFDPTNFPGDPAMYPALVASLRDRNDWEARRPGRRITQVLVAKSLRFADCPEDRIADIEKALGGDNKPKTYVVAVNNDDNDFDTIAAAGRTYPPMQISFRTRNPITPLKDTTSDFAAIIRKIRDNDGRCEYLVPTPPGTAVDYDKINLTASSGGLLFKKVADRAACGSDDQGWYYEPTANPDEPKRIVACEGACKILHGLQNQDAGPTSGTAKIQLGCPTVHASDAGR